MDLLAGEVENMRELIAALKAVADENRVRILWAVRRQELCVCQVVELLGLAQSTVSKHLSILHQAQFLESRKDGRWIYYRAAEAGSSAVARAIAEVVCKAYGRLPDSAKDDKLLGRILKIDRDELCRRQSRTCAAPANHDRSSLNERTMIRERPADR